MPNDSWRYVLRVDGREIELSDGEVTLGRSRTATVRVDHESVSRTHALLMLDNGNSLLKDLNSSNGTFVGGRRVIGETRLSDGDKVQIGAALLEFRKTAPESSVEKTRMIESSAPALAPPAASGIAIDRDDGPTEIDYHDPAGKTPREISASGLFRDVDRAARDPGTVVAAGGAVDAVRSSAPGSEEPPRPRVPSSPGFPAGERPRVAPTPNLQPVQSVQPVPPGGGILAVPGQTLSQIPLDLAPSRAPGAPPTARALEPAGVGKRLSAFLVDTVIVLALDLVLSSPVLLFLWFRGDLEAKEPGPAWALNGLLLLCGAMIAIVNLLYVVGSWARTGRTPGKALVGVRVVRLVDPRGRGIGYGPALLRALFFWLGVIPLGAGVLVAAFRKDRRAWHDLVAGTRVVKVR